MMKWSMKMNDKKNLDIIIQLIEEHGGRFIEVNPAREVLKFDIPRGKTRYDDKSILRDANFACKTLLNLKLAIRWVDELSPRPVPKKLAYENEINKALKTLFDDSFGKIKDEGEFIYRRDQALARCGTSISDLSDGLMKGVIEGHSIEQQLEVIVYTFSRIHKGLGL